MKIAPVVDVGVFFYLGIILATTSLERREVRRRAIGAHYTQPRKIRRVGGGTPCGCVLIRQTLERLYDMAEMRDGTGDGIASRENARMLVGRLTFGVTKTAAAALAAVGGLMS